MSNPFDQVARKVIKRIALETPGHPSVDAARIEPEFSVAFPNAEGPNRNLMVSEVLKSIECLVPEKHSDAWLVAQGGDRLYSEVYPVIWPHIAEQI